MSSLRNYEWQLLPPFETGQLVNVLNPVVKPEAMNAEQTEVRFCQLPFYENYRFCTIIDHSKQKPNARFALAGPQEIVLLNRTNEPIYRSNEKAPIKITRENIMAYAAFFFDHVAGRHGRFLIVETPEDINWEASATEEHKKSVVEHLKPLAYKGIGRDNRFTLEARVIFKNALFKTMIRVQPDGMIELTDEELLVEELPVVQDLPPQEFPLNQESEGQLY